MWKPNLGRSGESWGTHEVLNRPPESAYAAVTPEEVRQLWEQQYHASGLQPSGVPGARMEEKHVLTGAVLPFWGAISQACARHVHGMCTACARHVHLLGRHLAGDYGRLITCGHDPS